MRKFNLELRPLYTILKLSSVVEVKKLRPFGDGDELLYYVKKSKVRKVSNLLQSSSRDLPAVPVS